jgi:hypothetical protein
MTSLPVLEMAYGPIGNAPIEDPNTKEGKMWHDIFHDVTKVPGFQRVGWSRRLDKPEINMFAICTFMLLILPNLVRKRQR